MEKHRIYHFLLCCD